MTFKSATFCKPTPGITPSEVNALFHRCLRGDVVGGNAVLVQGVMHVANFNPGHIADHRARIIELLAMLPGRLSEVQPELSFTDAYFESRGRLWTEFPGDVDQLLMLGIAVGAVEFTAPREEWRESFPRFRVLLP